MSWLARSVFVDRCHKAKENKLANKLSSDLHFFFIHFF